jgi:hypothetical protein
LRLQIRSVALPTGEVVNDAVATALEMSGRCSGRHVHRVSNSSRDVITDRFTVIRRPPRSGSSAGSTHAQSHEHWKERSTLTTVTRLWLAGRGRRPSTTISDGWVFCGLLSSHSRVSMSGSPADRRAERSVFRGQTPSRAREPGRTSALWQLLLSGCRRGPAGVQSAFACDALTVALLIASAQHDRARGAYLEPNHGDELPKGSPEAGEEAASRQAG